MDVGEALADLLEISSQVQVAVVLGDGGEAVASTARDEAAARELARLVRELLDAAEGVRPDGSSPPLTQLAAATRAGSVFVVRAGGHTIAATTGPSPTVGLVFYDLKTCLRALGDGEAEEQAEPTAATATGPPAEEDDAAS